MDFAQLKNEIKQRHIILENSCVFLLLNYWVCLEKIIGFLRKLKAIFLKKNFNNHIIQVAQGYLNNCHKTTQPKLNF